MKERRLAKKEEEISSGKGREAKKVGEEKKKEGQVKKEVGEQKRYRNGDDTINYESNGKCSMNRQS